MYVYTRVRGEGYISIVDYDEFVCGMGGGDEGDAHVAFFSSLCMLTGEYVMGHEFMNS